jgi:cyclopropane fatty-acyl-phospholipid synthase-like methyltransferase
MPVPPSDPTDPWFGAHFSYAAPTVCEWLAPVMAPGAAILDFGCGDGITTLGVALAYPEVQLIGVDIHTAFDRLGERAADQLGLETLPPNLSFLTIEQGSAPAQPQSLDGFFSWSTFEHIDRGELGDVAAGLAAALKDGGLGFVQIEPLYHSAYGSHLGSFVDEPWAHLLLSHEEFVARSRQAAGEIDPEARDERYRRRGAEGHRERMIAEFESLNGITANELVKVWSTAGIRVNREHRAESDLVPPKELLGRYRSEDLVTNEVRMLIERPTPRLLSRLWRRR